MRRKQIERELKKNGYIVTSALSEFVNRKTKGRGYTAEQILWNYLCIIHSGNNAYYVINAMTVSGRIVSYDEAIAMHNDKHVRAEMLKIFLLECGATTIECISNMRLLETFDGHLFETKDEVLDFVRR